MRSVIKAVIIAGVFSATVISSAASTQVQGFGVGLTCEVACSRAADDALNKCASGMMVINLENCGIYEDGSGAIATRRGRVSILAVVAEVEAVAVAAASAPVFADSTAT